jgi:hypothetical protein
MSRTHPTLSADISVLEIGAISLNDNNRVRLAAKNAIDQAPHRIVSIGIDSLEGQILAFWKDHWDEQQLLIFLKTQQRELLAQPYEPRTLVPFCNPAGAYREKEHNALGNAEWSACIHDDYAHADIQDRKVMQFIFCFWKSLHQNVYFVQYELAYLMPQLIAAAKQR